MLFLASPRLASITGDEITVDGGDTRNIIGVVPRAGFDGDAVEEAGEDGCLQQAEARRKAVFSPPLAEGAGGGEPY